MTLPPAAAAGRDCARQARAFVAAPRARAGDRRRGPWRAPPAASRYAGVISSVYESSRTRQAPPDRASVTRGRRRTPPRWSAARRVPRQRGDRVGVRPSRWPLVQPGSTSGPSPRRSRSRGGDASARPGGRCPAPPRPRWPRPCSRRTVQRASDAGRVGGHDRRRAGAQVGVRGRRRPGRRGRRRGDRGPRRAAAAAQATRRHIRRFFMRDPFRSGYGLVVTAVISQPPGGPDPPQGEEQCGDARMERAPRAGAHAHPRGDRDRAGLACGRWHWPRRT